MKDKSILITCLGDIAPIDPAGSIILSSMHAHKNHFESFFAKSDIVFGNLETPLSNATPPAEDKKYLFKADHRVADIFPEKFVFSLANNHILDFGHEGLLDTISHLSAKGIRYTGAGKNLEAAGKPVIINCKGNRIGFLAAADLRYPAATSNTPGLFPATSGLLCPKIKRLRQKTDIVYVSIHMGMEFIPVPAPSMIDIARQCHQAGAQVVFFHHSHCLSGHTITHDSITLWGTGNFLFPEILPYHFQPWFDSAAWHIIHQLPENSIRADVEPFTLDKSGLPQKPETTAGNTILQHIDFLSRRINKKDKLGWLRLASMCKPDYINLFIGNYADIKRPAAHGQADCFRR